MGHSMTSWSTSWKVAASLGLEPTAKMPISLVSLLLGSSVTHKYAHKKHWFGRPIRLPLCEFVTRLVTTSKGKDVNLAVAAAWLKWPVAISLVLLLGTRRKPAGFIGGMMGGAGKTGHQLDT
jgi:hypothetical protein